MNLPERNNVYGIMQCRGQLNEVAEIVGSALSLAKSEIHIKTSEFNGEQKLMIRSIDTEFDAYFTGIDEELLFNGAVAGSAEQVSELVQKIHNAFKAAGFTPRFEIYNDAQHCIAEFNA